MESSQISGEINRSASHWDALVDELRLLDSAQAAGRLAELRDEQAAEVLALLSPATAEEILLALPETGRQSVIAAAPIADGRQWLKNLSYRQDSVGRLMDPAQEVFPQEWTVAETIERIRELAKSVLVTYGFIVDPMGMLVGVVAMRDLLLAEHASRLQDIMLRQPFALHPELKVLDAMKVVVKHHFPIYPVCDDSGRIVGTVRGRTLFEKQAFEISAQVGSMVGVEKEERLSTPWTRSFRYRHPWLQLNLLTAFIAAGVVGIFQSTIDKIVLLAVFLPVLAGQSGNTGCQSLAVTLRGLTLGELRAGRERALVLKEGFLGMLNGSLVGITAGLGMFALAVLQRQPHPGWLGLVVFLAMIGSCVTSGICGALIPLTLRRLGADPATASSIFLTTATDVASMGLFLGLASALIA